jgi:alkylhydroperoxidase family enzyme
VALEYADAMTNTAQDVDDALFTRVREHSDEEQIAELTMLIACENASSRFNRALRVPSAELWTPA